VNQPNPPWLRGWHTRLPDFDTAIYKISMKRWCQLNRARVAHDARPALSSYQNKCCKPGRSHHNSDICNLWSLTVLLICIHYDSTDWNLWSGQRRRPISDIVGQHQLLWGLCVTVYVCYSVDQFFFSTLVHSTFCVQVEFVLIVPMLQRMAKWKQYDKVQCLLCSEVSGCVNFTSMSEIPTKIGIFYNITISLITVDKGKK